MNVQTVFNIATSNGDIQSVKTEGAGQNAATSAYNSAKSVKGRAILEGFLIDGEFKPVDLRDHFQRMRDKNK